MPPLSGLRVLDFTLNLPGPYATAVLAAQGADVVKVEPPKGDPARHLPALFDRLNRGKRSIALDLRSDEGSAALSSLFEWADVVIESFRPGVMERLQAGPEQAHAVDPRIVYCRISAFGQTGPRAHEPGHDLNLQALTGFCHLERSKQPTAVRLPIADLSASMSAVAAIGIALSGTRESIVLDVSMADTLQSWSWVWDAVDLGENVDQTLPDLPLKNLMKRGLGPLRARLRRDKLYAMPQYQLYRAQDGWLAVGIVDEHGFWQRFAEAVGLKRYRTLRMGPLTVLGPLLRRRIARRLRRQTVHHWMGIFGSLDLPVTPVLSPHQAQFDPQLSRRVQQGCTLPPLPKSHLPPGPVPTLGSTCWTTL